MTREPSRTRRAHTARPSLSFASGSAGPDPASGCAAGDRARFAAGAADIRPGGGGGIAPPGGSAGRHGAIRTLRAALRGFWTGERGSVAIETALAILVLVVAFAGVMELVRDRYTDDRMARAARAVARSLALDPTLDACAPIRRELDLANDFDCATASWTLKVDRGVGIDVLPAPLDLDASLTPVSGDLVLVRIGRESELKWIGLARCEAELCGQETS